MKCPFCGMDAVYISIEDDEGNEHYDDYEDNPWSGLWYGIRHRRVKGACPLDNKMYSEIFEIKDEAEKTYENFLDNYEYLDEVGLVEDYGDLEPVAISNAAFSAINFVVKWEDSL